MENETIKHVITQEDLDANPALVAEGVKVGDEVELPEITELGIEAGKIHAAAVAEGKTDEEALTLVEAFYKAHEEKKATEDGTKEEEVKTDEPAKEEEKPAEEVPVTTEIAPVEPVKPVDEEVVEKEVPFVNGRILDGKELVVARWNGDKLVVETSERTEFTLSGKELENFLLG